MDGRAGGRTEISDCTYSKSTCGANKTKDERETWAEEGPWQADNPEFSGGCSIFLVAIISGKMHSGSVPLFLRREIECRGSCHSAGREELGLGKNFFARRGLF